MQPASYLGCRLPIFLVLKRTGRNQYMKLWQREAWLYFLQITEIYSLLVKDLNRETNNIEKNVCILKSASCCHKSMYKL